MKRVCGGGEGEGWGGGKRVQVGQGKLGEQEEAGPGGEAGRRGWEGMGLGKGVGVVVPTV